MDEALRQLSSNDPVLGKLIGRYPRPKLAKHTHYYQELVESIIGQQLSVNAARAIRQRFVALFESDFPSPKQILACDIETLRTVGLGRSKATYIQDLARKVIDGEVQFDTLDSLTNQEIIDELTRIKGVGIWTVHMFLMFCMARLDVLAVGDLGIRNGVMKLYGFDHVPLSHEVEQVAANHGWHPFETIACLYVWQSLENKPLD